METEEQERRKGMLFTFEMLVPPSKSAILGQIDLDYSVCSSTGKTSDQIWWIKHMDIPLLLHKTVAYDSKAMKKA